MAKETKEKGEDQPKSKFDRKAWDKEYRKKHPEKFASYRKKYYDKKKKDKPTSKTSKKEEKEEKEEEEIEEPEDNEPVSKKPEKKSKK